MVKKHKRRLIQLASALIYNINIGGFAKGKIYTGKLKGICVPGLNCYSCPGAVGACPLGSLQASLASLNYGMLRYVLGIMLLFGILFGRMVCAVLCPFGLLQELIYKIPSPKLKKSRTTRALSYFKYIVLALFVVIIPVALYIQNASGSLRSANTFARQAAGCRDPLLTSNEALRASAGALFALKAALLAPPSLHRFYLSRFLPFCARSALFIPCSINMRFSASK